ncbi:MAG: MarR family transcriptional regulator [Hyphomonadaceae bacterium]
MTQPNRRMFRLLARAQRRATAAADLSLADLELTSTQAGALFCFKDEGLLIRELASALDLAQSAASGLAGRLEHAGLVTRGEEKGDGRAARLRLTPPVGASATKPPAAPLPATPACFRASPSAKPTSLSAGSIRRLA